ncbi:MAG TPA: MFS transporter [Casimicrobiaceae bacterium]|nr:MFS transporter [Casimicrobiaceae bacterium]
MRSASLRALLTARGLRAFGDGFVSLILPLYLLDLGMTPFDVGVIATATLLGSGVLTLAVGYRAHRFHLRTMLVAAAALMTATGVGFALVRDFWPLFAIAVIGTLNPSSGDVSVFLPLEHALVAKLAPEARRTSWFARYSLVGSLCASVGALAAGVPHLVAHASGLSPHVALQAMFGVYALLGVGSALVYRRLPTSEVQTQQTTEPLHASRKIVYTLAALFSLDALGGGLIVQSMVALWLFERFALSTATAGAIFFWTGVLSALSYLVAARIATRIGLVYTMVFTHLPSNVLLLLVPFAPNLATSIALLLLRSALSQMDVPTRNSFVMAVVPAAERPAAASVTSVPRSLAAAVSPLAAGYLLGVSAFGWPLVVAGVIKIAYDLAFLAMFRGHVARR